MQAVESVVGISRIEYNFDRKLTVVHRVANVYKNNTEVFRPALAKGVGSNQVPGYEVP
jgi:hypothetical protein